jgi:hypothetical protein
MDHSKYSKGRDVQIRYKNNLKELVALQKFALRHTEVGKKMMFHRFVAVESILLFIAVLFAVNHNRTIVLLVFLLVSGLAWLFRERSVLLQFKKDFKRERRKNDTDMFEKERIMTIAPDGLTVEIGEQRTHYTWDHVAYMGKDRKHVYILLTGMLHYVIPLSAFSNHSPEALLEAIDTYRS